MVTSNDEFMVSGKFLIDVYLVGWLLDERSKPADLSLGEIKGVKQRVVALCNQLTKHICDQFEEAEVSEQLLNESKLRFEKIVNSRRASELEWDY